MKHLDILKRNIKKFAVGATVFAALVVPALKCYGVTPEELENVYLEKHEIDMKRW